MFTIVGTTTADFFISGLDHIPVLGGNEFTTSNLAFCQNPMTLVLGGNGGNTAFALGRLGGGVTLCSALGQDTVGDLAAGWLAEAGVDTIGLVRTADAATSTTTVVTDDALNRISFHHPGASDHFQRSHIDEMLLARQLKPKSILLITGYTLLPRWRPEGVRALLYQARQAGVTTALDIGPAIGQPAAMVEIAGILPLVDYLLCNDHELSTCTREANLYTGMERIRQAGASWAVIKRGSQGVTLAGPERSPASIQAFPAQARFTVGAGDAFNAGFLYALHQGQEPVRAARFANATAALVVAGEQGILGAPTLAQVQEKMGM